jgi:hypothetical protein
MSLTIVNIRAISGVESVNEVSELIVVSSRTRMDYSHSLGSHCGKVVKMDCTLVIDRAKNPSHSWVRRVTWAWPRQRYRVAKKLPANPEAKVEHRDEREKYREAFVEASAE